MKTDGGCESDLEKSESSSSEDEQLVEDFRTIRHYVRGTGWGKRGEIGKASLKQARKFHS